MKSVWLASELHRRSQELSIAFNAHYIALLSSDNDIPVPFIRYCFIFVKSFFILLKFRPSNVYVQNPSIFLTLSVCLLKSFLRYRVIVDRHSNFKLNTLSSVNPKWRLFHKISKYTVLKADLTIVTNDFLKEVVLKWGGRGFVLQDKMPVLSIGEKVELSGKKNIVVVSSFDSDEPVEAIFKSATKLPIGWYVYMTGNYCNKIADIDSFKGRNKNLILTGYVTEKVYQDLLVSADLVVVLTTEDNLLTCGAYEAISLGKALLLSNSDELKSYFSKGAIYTNNDTESIRQHMIEGVENRSTFERNANEIREKLIIDWDERFFNLNKKLFNK